MKQNSKVIKALMLITQLGISMMVPIFLCVFAGNFIDKKAGTSFVMPVFLFLGIAAAFRNVYYLLKPFYAGDKEREDAELAYIERLKAEGRRQAAGQNGAREDASTKPQGSGAAKEDASAKRKDSGTVKKEPADTETKEQ